MKAVIPTGGRGTRMQPITFSANKHFIPVANKPLIFYPIETVVSAGIKDILITYNLGTLDLVKSFLGDGSRWGAKFTYVLQEEPKGLANVFQVCEKDLQGSPFLMHNGDNVFTKGIKDIVEYFLKNKPSGLVTMVHHKDNRRLGVPYFDENNRLIQYVEKPENPPHDFAIPCLYFFDSNVFKAFRGKDKIKPSVRGELEINSPYQWLIDHGYKVDVIEYKGKWLDPGKFDDWLDANRYILENQLEEKNESKIDPSSRVSGKISMGTNCKIINSQIIGPSIIGDNVQIRDSEVGPFVSISDNCVIEKSRIENSILMQSVKIADVDRKIDTSIFGPQSEFTDVNERSSSISLFIGEKSRIEV